MAIMKDRLKELRKKYEKMIGAAFFDSLETIKGSVSINAIITAIENNDWDEVVNILQIDRAAFRPVDRTMAEAFEDGGTSTAAALSAGAARAGRGAQASFRFDVRNRRAESWLIEQSSTMITRIVEDTRAGVRNLLESGMITGRNPRSVALDIVGRIDPGTGRRTGGIVGLSGPQQLYVSNARSELAGGDLKNYLNRRARDKRFDSYVNKAINDGVPIPDNIQSKMIARYTDNLIRIRGEAIARTESIRSLNQGQFEAMQQGMESGTVRAVRKIWDSAGDDRVRDSHAELDGESVRIDEPFTSPATGKTMMFPLDASMGAEGEDVINCRCRIRYDVDF